MIQPIYPFVKSEWRIWLPLSAFAFVAASLLMSGYPQGLLPELHVPFTYGGDGLAYLWNIQRAIEGAWYFENERSGFPFGSNHLDYPTSDTGTYLALKLLGWLLQTPIAAMNVYYLLGFSLCSVAAYLVTRTMGVSKHFSIATALIYAFSSFHFWRLGHLFFTWYFVAPLFFYVGFRLFTERLIFTDSALSLKTKLLNASALIVFASFGIYYALFGCFVLLLCTIMASVYQRSWKYLLEGALTIGFVVLGVLLNVMPSLVYIFTNGENREGVGRFAAESELYALKITQLLLPRADHRLDSFFEFASRYNGSFPLVTENISSSLGLIGALGFLLLMANLVLSLVTSHTTTTSKNFNQANSFQLRFRILAILALGMVLLATVGGGSSLFAMLISTSIRSWNRISIFIAFISVLALMLCVNLIITKYAKPTYSWLASAVLALMLLVLGIYDQTVRPCHTCISANQTLITNDAAFIHGIEANLPPRAAIYQLPYVAYPENGSVNGLGSYDQARGLLNSSQLRWSFGGMRGRMGDWFFRKLALLPINQQITVIKAMGFSGVYIDRRGYLGAGVDKRCAPFDKSKIDRIANSCLTIDEVERDIADAVGPDFSQRKMVSKDALLSFTPVKPLGIEAVGISTQNIVDISLADSYLKPIGFKLQNGIPIQTDGGFDEPLDLRKGDLDFPHYVGRVTGLAGFTVVNAVNVGRFSDAMEAKKVTVWLSKPLPKRFTLQIRAEAAGPNAGKPLKIKIGNQVKEVVFSDKFSTQSLVFETSKSVFKIEFTPFEPFSPARRWGAGDTRFLAVNFQQITITPE
jgi:phosphoglycerol transferase